MAVKLTPAAGGDSYYGDNVRVYVPTTYNYSPVGISPDKWWVGRTKAKDAEKYSSGRLKRRIVLLMMGDYEI